MDSIGDRIKWLRDKRQLSQRELAKRVGVTEATLSRYETNKRIPGADTVAMLAHALGATTDFITCLSNMESPWWEKDSPPKTIDLEEFINHSSNLRLMGQPLDAETKDDLLRFLRAAYIVLKEKNRPANTSEQPF